jgi:hypothetical protein
MSTEGWQELQKGWRSLRKGKVEIAREAFQKSHMELQDQMLMHSITHISLAMTYRNQPIKRTKEFYLGIMAPWATFRINRRIRKKEKKNERP